jgi:hypothetical protein
MPLIAPYQPQLLGMLPLLCRPGFTVCTLHLNWGCILSEDVTITVRTTHCLRACSPSFTVCTWYLNWGRILLQDVTFVGFSATAASSLSEPAPLLITETGMCVL